jgi:hypothetical protein
VIDTGLFPDASGTKNAMSTWDSSDPSFGCLLTQDRAPGVLAEGPITASHFTNSSRSEPLHETDGAPAKQDKALTLKPDFTRLYELERGC